MDWNELRAAVVDAIDVEAEYRALGVRMVDGAQANEDGWLRCHAVGREDARPSAAINVRSGYYKDSGTGIVSSLWDFAAEQGSYTDWKTAFRHYATDVAKIPKKDWPGQWEDQWQEKVHFHKRYSRLTVRGFLRTYPEASLEALRLTGARLADYPKKAPEPFPVLAWPMYGPNLLEEAATGVVVQSADGRMLPIWQGREKKPDLRKRTNIGKSGLVGTHGLQLIESGRAEVIYKVEGISDLLALQAVIPQDLRDSHAVITNGSGATESRVPKTCARAFAGANVVLIHDADRAGQDGAKVWVNYLRHHVRMIRNVQISDEIAAKHGRDLRDWLGEHSWDDFRRLVEETNLYEAPEDGEDDELLNEDQQILRQLGIVVLGHTESGRVKVFTAADGRVWEIRDLRRYSSEDLILHVGRDVFDNVVGESREKLLQVRMAVAAEANSRRIVDDKQLGCGIWELSDRLALVNAGEALLWNGTVEKTRVPFTEHRLFDFQCEPWFSADRVEEQLQQASSRKWCIDVLSEAEELFGRWDNWRFDDLPLLIASLISCTWLQTVWPIRPLVAISGPTNSGKTIFLKAIEAIFGPLALSVSRPSEAGIRQFVGHSARVLIIDEFEADKHRAQILELFRTSSRGQQIIRGSAGHGGARFGLRHIPWVGAIELGLQDPADRNRFIQCDLLQRDKSKGSRLVVPADEELVDLGLRLMVVGMQHWKSALKLLQPLRSSNWGSHDLRLVEIYSVPVAMISAVLGHDENRARDVLRHILDARGDETSIETDETELLSELFQSDVYLARGKVETVAALLQQLPDNEAASALARNGIARKEADGEMLLFIAPKTVCSKLLKNSATSQRDISQILKRIVGAMSGHRHRCSGHHLRGIAIPMSSLGNLLGSDEEVLF